MANTDKYYDNVDQEQVDTTVKMVHDALKYACEKHYLTEREINVLSRMLILRKDGNDDDGMYEHVVDFLWMGYRIGLNQKHLLLDLLDD